MEEPYENYLNADEIMLEHSPLVEFKEDEQQAHVEDHQQVRGQDQAPPQPQQQQQQQQQQVTQEEGQDTGKQQDQVQGQQQGQQEQVTGVEPQEEGAQGEEMLGESVFANVGAGLTGHYRNMMMAYWQETINSIEHEDHDFKNHQLPLARIKKVMKTDEEVRMISAEAPILFAKGCDIFITELTMRAWIHAEENKRRTLQRSDIAAALQKSDMFDFLIDIVPREEDRPKRQSSSRQGSMAYQQTGQQPPQPTASTTDQAQSNGQQTYDSGEYSSYTDIPYESRY